MNERWPQRWPLTRAQLESPDLCLGQLFSPAEETEYRLGVAYALFEERKGSMHPLPFVYTLVKKINKRWAYVRKIGRLPANARAARRTIWMLIRVVEREPPPWKLPQDTQKLTEDAAKKIEASLKRWRRKLTLATTKVAFYEKRHKRQQTRMELHAPQESP